MDPLTVVEIGRDAILVVLLVSGPLLGVGLVVGLAVGVFQAVTQIHEMTLTFIPKILAITVVLLLMLPWMLLKLIDYIRLLFDRIPLAAG